MANTSITRRLRTAGVASAIFAVGAGIGWQFADMMFRGEPTSPIVAAIHFETARPHEASGREQVSRPAPDQAVEVPRQPQTDTVAKQSDEERKLSDALQWVDKYRQRQETAAWEAVGRHQLEVQKLAQAQVAQAFTDIGTIKLADAGTKLEMGAHIEKAAGQGTSVVQVRHVRKPGGAVKRRVAHRQPSQSSRRAPEVVMCPLRWLEAVVAGAAVELRTGRRQHRHAIMG